MTETQSIDHAAPLGPGEIRTHTVGEMTFQVMHVAGGSFTQTSVRGDRNSRVLATDRFETVAVQAYADAIMQAEMDILDADEEWAAPMVIGSTPTVRAEDGTPDADAMFNTPIGANPTLVTGEKTGLPGTCQVYGEKGGQPSSVAVGNERQQAALAVHLDALTPWPGDSLRELVEAYGEAMAKGAIEISYVDLRGDVDDAAVRHHANRADALKAEILKRFGGV